MNPAGFGEYPSFESLTPPDSPPVACRVKPMGTPAVEEWIQRRLATPEDELHPEYRYSLAAFPESLCFFVSGTKISIRRVLNIPDSEKDPTYYFIRGTRICVDPVDVVTLQDSNGNTHHYLEGSPETYFCCVEGTLYRFI
jgi:hypothetical protein